MNLKVKRIVFAILTLSTFITIFIFSSQNGDESQAISGDITRKIIEILQIGKGLDGTEKEELIKDFQYVIRKLAHFTIYTIAGINMFGFINTFNIKIKYKIGSVLLVGVFYAISDEFHQMFSDGRTPAVRDVGIDSLGVMFGILLFLAAIKAKKAINKGD